MDLDKFEKLTGNVDSFMKRLMRRLRNMQLIRRMTLGKAIRITVKSFIWHT